MGRKPEADGTYSDIDLASVLTIPDVANLAVMWDLPDTGSHTYDSNDDSDGNKQIASIDSKVVSGASSTRATDTLAAADPTPPDDVVSGNDKRYFPILEPITGEVSGQSSPKQESSATPAQYGFSLGADAAIPDPGGSGWTADDIVLFQVCKYHNTGETPSVSAALTITRRGVCGINSGAFTAFQNFGTERVFMSLGNTIYTANGQASNAFNNFANFTGATGRIPLSAPWPSVMVYRGFRETGTPDRTSMSFGKQHQNGGNVKTSAVSDPRPYAGLAENETAPNTDFVTRDSVECLGVVQGKWTDAQVEAFVDSVESAYGVPAVGSGRIKVHVGTSQVADFRRNGRGYCSRGLASHTRRNFVHGRGSICLTTDPRGDDFASGGVLDGFHASRNSDIVNWVANLAAGEGVVGLEADVIWDVENDCQMAIANAGAALSNNAPSFILIALEFLILQANSALTLAGATDIKHWFVNIPPFPDAQENQTGVDLDGFTTGSGAQHREQFNTVVAASASIDGVIDIAADSRYDRSGTPGEFVNPDGLHFTEEGDTNTAALIDAALGLSAPGGGGSVARPLSRLAGRMERLGR